MLSILEAFTQRTVRTSRVLKNAVSCLGVEAQANQGDDFVTTCERHGEIFRR